MHPALIQASVGAWLSASILDLTGGDEKAARKLVTAGLTAAIPAVLTGAVDWSEQHEQQMRVGVVHAAGNIAALTLYGASLMSRGLLGEAPVVAIRSGGAVQVLADRCSHMTA